MNHSFFHKVTNALLAVMLTFLLVLSSFAHDVQAEEISFKDIPQISITTTDGSGLSLEKATGYVPATISITAEDAEDVVGSGQVKVRGNTTAELAKKPYTIKFDSKQNVMGMGKAKKWILLANYLDKSMMRNYLAFNLAAQLRLDYITPCYFVDVTMDGKYLGNYLLTEQVEEVSTRVDIDSDKGDFLLEYEASREEPEDFYIRTPIYGYRFILHSPEKASKEQLNAIDGVLTKVETAIEKGNIEEIEKVIDLDSFVDFYLFNEFIKNVDFGFSSTRFYCKDGILYAGSAWDYDQSMGNAATEFHDKREQSSGIWCQSIWYTKLTQNKAFMDLCIQRFEEIQDIIRNLYETNGLVDQTYETYHDAFWRDHDIAGWGQQAMFNPALTNLDENIAFLKKWLSERNDWLCKVWKCGDYRDVISGDIDGDQIVTLCDTQMALQAALRIKQIEESSKQYMSADVDCDGKITIVDALQILKYALKISSDFKIAE